MFSLLMSADDKLKTLSKNVAYNINIELDNGSKIDAYVPGGSLEVDTMLDRWVNYTGDLICFTNCYVDDRGVHLVNRLALDIDHAVGAYVRVIPDPIPIIGYFATDYLKPIKYRN